MSLTEDPTLVQLQRPTCDRDRGLARLRDVHLLGKLGCECACVSDVWMTHYLWTSLNRKQS
jgi:hypothetical protein